MHARSEALHCTNPPQWGTSSRDVDAICESILAQPASLKAFLNPQQSRHTCRHTCRPSAVRARSLLPKQKVPCGGLRSRHKQAIFILDEITAAWRSSTAEMEAEAGVQLSWPGDVSGTMS